MQLKFLPSFVKRKGRITKRQELGLNELENFSISTIENINIEKEKFSQCHLEIGFGNAENLCSMAKSYPDILFIGSEVYASGVGSLLATIKEDNIKNIRIFNQDIRILLDKNPEEVFDKVIIICPDPWPKDRHHKRRLINEEFLHMLYKTIKPAGVIYISTDWEHYAESIKNSLEISNYFSNTKTEEKLTFSKFENRGIEEGREIFEFRYVKN